MSIEQPDDAWNAAATPIYLCFDAEDLYAARMVRDYPLTNADLEHYVARENAPPDSTAAHSIKDQLRAHLESARALVCLIGPLTAENPWVAWELEAARGLPARPGLVGAFLDERHPRPAAIQSAGAVFVPFNRDHLERAIRWACTAQPSTDDFEFRDMAW